MNSFSFSQKLEAEFKKGFPGLRVRAYKSGEMALDYSWGQVFRYYDIASVTKIVFTVSAMMIAVERKLVSLEDKVQKHLSWIKPDHLTVSMLLAHHSGFVWWLPIYEDLKKNHLLGRENYPKNWLYLQTKLEEQSVQPTNKSTYSDLDFWLLGFLLEELFQKELYEIWSEIRQLFGLSETYFHKSHKPIFSVKDYAPTENCPWRGPLQGAVHDDNTWALGGVASHSGLFSSVDDLSQWFLKIREIYFSKESGVNSFLSSRTVRKFLTQSGPGRWGLGFMMPDFMNSSAGEKMAKNSFGHWGFTGTGAWFDPENDIVLVTLSNRVYPTRENEKIKELRPLIHDEVYQFLGV